VLSAERALPVDARIGLGREQALELHGVRGLLLGELGREPPGAVVGARRRERREERARAPLGGAARPSRSSSTRA
jgi:hypothetical protein